MYLLLSSTHHCVRVATYNNIYRNSPNPGIYLRNFKFPIQMPQQSTHRVHSYKVRNWLPINSLQHCTQQYATVQNRTLRFSREPLCTTNCRQGSTFFQTLSGLYFIISAQQQQEGSQQYLWSMQLTILPSPKTNRNTSQTTTCPLEKQTICKYLRVLLWKFNMYNIMTILDGRLGRCPPQPIGFVLCKAGSACTLYALGYSSFTN